MVKKMTNLELINALDSLIALQDVEKEALEKRWERLLKGRVKISYAVNKNITTLKEALEAYQETLGKLDEEMRDSEAEKEAVEKAKEEGHDLNSIEMIFKEGFTKEDYITKRKELFEIENEVDIYEVDLELFDGIELNSSEIGMLMFMLRE